MSAINRSSSPHELFHDGNAEKCLLKRAFEIVREEQNKGEEDFISIMDVLQCFQKEEIEKKEDKISLSWCAICMIRQKKDEIEFTDKEVESLTDNIMKKLKIYLEKN